MMDKEKQVLNCTDWIFNGGARPKRIKFYTSETKSS